MSKFFAVTNVQDDRKMMYIAKDAVISLRAVDTYTLQTYPGVQTLINLPRETVYAEESIENIRNWIDSK